MGSAGAEGFLRRELQVSGINPLANFTFSPEMPDFLDNITFYDSSSDLDGDIVSWFWNFGDGTNSSDTNPIHNYKNPGFKVVTLKVTDEHDLTNIKVQLLLISKVSPDANFSFSPKLPTPPTAAPRSGDASPPSSRSAPASTPNSVAAKTSTSTGSCWVCPSKR